MTAEILRATWASSERLREKLSDTSRDVSPREKGKAGVGSNSPRVLFGEPAGCGTSHMV